MGLRCGHRRLLAPAMVALRSTTVLSTLVNDPDTDQTHEAVAALRAVRRRRRLGDTEWGDLAYRVYTTAFFCLVVLIMLSGWVGDSRASDATVARVAAEGPAWAGLLVAVMLLGGIRSGSRGGPVSLEAADVHHLLLTPPDRTRTLRRPTVGVLGYGIATGVITVALLGSLMHQRLPGGGAAWIASAALFGSVLVAAALGAALVTCSRRLPGFVPLVIGWGLLLWAIADVADRAPTAPTTFAGKLLFWPLETAALGLPWVVLAIALALVGTAAIGGLSIEAARRRTQLVGQLRFAVTQQDLRSVVLLRRQLASEMPRNRPWFRVPRAVGRRFPVAARDLQSVAHWPAIRVLRVAVLGAGAALAVRGVWSGTTPLIVVAGLATFVAALDATEPLSQEIDHPTLAESMPVPEGMLRLRHVVAPTLVMLVAGCLGLGVAWAVDPSPEVLRVGPVVVVTAALAAVAGATISVVSGSDPGGADALMTPEVAGPRLVFRTVWPPLVAVLGFLPALLAARAPEGTDPVGVATTLGIVVLVLVSMVFGWVRFRSDIHGAMAQSMQGGPER